MDAVEKKVKTIDIEDLNIMIEIEDKVEEGFNLDNIESWKEFVETNKLIYKSVQSENSQELKAPFKGSNNCQEEWNKINSLLQIKKKAKIYSKNEAFNNIIEGAKKLLSHNDEPRSAAKIDRAIARIMKYLNGKKDRNRNMHPIWRPKTSAKDRYGFSQELFCYWCRGENLSKTFRSIWI